MTRLGFEPMTLQAPRRFGNWEKVLGDKTHSVSPDFDVSLGPRTHDLPLAEQTLYQLYPFD